MPSFNVPVLKLQTKLAISFTGLTALIAALFVSILFLNYRAQNRQNIKAQLREVAAIAALQVDGDLHAQIQREDDQKKAAYREIKTALNRVQKAGDGIVYIYTMRADSAGRVRFIVDPEEEPDPIGTIYEDAGPVLAAQIETMKSPVVEDAFYTDEWGTWLSGYAPIYRSDGQPEGILGIDISAGSILAKEKQLLLICVLAFGISILIAAGLGLYVARVISRPITGLSQLADKISQIDLPALLAAMTSVTQGDLQVSVSIQTEAFDYHAGDEIGALSEALNTVIARLQDTGQVFRGMTSNLKDMVGQVAQNAHQLSRSSRSLAAIANQTGRNTDQISVTIQQIARGAAQQSESISSTAASMEQISRAVDGIAAGAQNQASAVAKASHITAQIAGAIEQVSTNAESGVRGSNRAALVARDGALAVDATVQGMGTIKASVGLSVQKVKEMGQRSIQISTIVETVEEIASQTNLLALNAAIEAARAGEKGKGFGVVADEVRKLAERASASTREIGSLIKDIQKTVAEAVATMDESNREVDRGVVQSQEAGKALGEILQAVEQVNKQVEQISTAARKMSRMSDDLVAAVDTVSVVVEENAASTREMAASSAEVSRAVENIASVSEENSAAVEEISASAEETNSQAGEAAKGAQSLADMSHGLQELVSRFKLDADHSGQLPESEDEQPLVKSVSSGRAKTALAAVGEEGTPILAG